MRSLTDLSDSPESRHDAKHIRRPARALIFCLAITLVLICPPAALAQRELVVNGGFEHSTEGWMWEQWAGKPIPGVLDTSDKPAGAASFKMGVAGAPGGRWLSKQIDIPAAERGRDHVLTFQLKLQDVPDNAAAARLGIRGRGWLHGGDLVRTGGTQGWKAYTVPVSGSDLGDAADVTLFFYHDQIGAGVIGIAGVSFRAGPPPAGAALTEAAAGGVTLSGDTSEPATSMFTPGQKVELTFTVNNLKAPARPVTLHLSIVDEHGRQLQAKDIPVRPDASGHWQTTAAAPSARRGFYRVYAKLSDGVPLQAVGSRAAGFLTYAVVPDPAPRRDYGETGSRFGMQGGFGPWGSKIGALLGYRWVLDNGLEWNNTEPDHAGQFGPDQARQYAAADPAGRAPWHEYPLPTLFAATKWATVPDTLTYMTGTLTPEGEKAWDAYCRKAAAAFMAKYPQLKQHVYQITWEPIQPWGFKGTDADLVRIYRIAYRALHAVDPRAVVSGPTRGFYNNGDPRDTIHLLQLGLGKYLDGYTVHDYYSITPEKDGMPQAIRDMKAALRRYAHKDLPMFGTEQGWSTGEDPAKDLEQAQGLLRQNLIALGEGLQFNFGFYIVDYRMSGQKGYGYFYNLDPDVKWGPEKISPRPIAPAYAAQTMLLDGCVSDGAIEWLGDTICGYVFERPGHRVLALWNYGDAPRSVSLPTGVKQVRVYDWMGNERLAATTGGTVTVTLGPDPVYITGVSPRLWGRAAAKLLTVRQTKWQAYPNGSLAVTGSAGLPGNRPFRATLRLEALKPSTIPPLAQRLELRTAKRTPFRLAVHVPAKLRPGTYPVRLILQDAAGATVSATGINLHVVAPLSVSAEPASGAGGKPGVAITLLDKQGQGLAGRLDFRLKELRPGALRSSLPMIDLIQDPGKTKDVPGTSRQLAFHVPAGGRQRLVVPLPGAALSPARRYQALIGITAASGLKFAETAAVDFLAATRLTHPVTIDGDIFDWAAIPAVRLAGPGDVVRSPEYYPQGLTAQMRFAWDQSALYVAAEVKDDTFVQNETDAMTWRGDSLQLAFNLDPGRPDTAPNAGDRRTSEITVALTKSGPQTWRALSYAEEKLAVGAVSPRQIPVAIRRVGDGRLTYEIAIPWAQLGLAGGRPLRSGDTIGIAATVNEMHSADQSDPCALGIFAGIVPDKDPDKHGTLVLAGPG